MTKAVEKDGSNIRRAGRQKGAGATGSNQARVRDYNMRLVLSLVLRSGGLPGAQIARLTGLSAQTISVIIRQLESEGLLLRGAPQRGRVGQPSIPMSLNPDGAFALGLKVGRRSTTMVLVDFAGRIRDSRRRFHRFPDLEETIDFSVEAAQSMITATPKVLRGRIAGLGVAAPYEIWNWTEIIGAPEGTLDDWRNADIAGALRDRLAFPVHIENDCTAACCAENVFGIGTEHDDFLYIFIGSFIGGGIVLNGALYPGPTANAGAVGSMPVVFGDGTRGPLLGAASLYVLEQMLVAEGYDPSPVWLSPENWQGFGEILDRWIDMAAGFIAQAIVSACCTLDFPAVIIDGAIPDNVRARLNAAIGAALHREDMRGLTRPSILAGRTGPMARAIGGASLSLVDGFLLDRKVLTLGSNSN